MDLLPCPFCNCLHAPSVHGDERGFFVWCDTNYGGCGSRGAVASTNKGAIIVWNHRAPVTTASDGVVTVLRHTGPLPSPATDVIPPLANAPTDPALLALAKFGADVIASHRGPTGRWAQPALLALLDIARDTGVSIDGQLAHGIADAIARLLAPDGAASEGVDA